MKIGLLILTLFSVVNISRIEESNPRKYIADEAKGFGFSN